MMLEGSFIYLELEATMGFAPMNNGFADRRVRLLLHVAKLAEPVYFTTNMMLNFNGFNE